MKLFIDRLETRTFLSTSNQVDSSDRYTLSTDYSGEEGGVIIYYDVPPDMPELITLQLSRVQNDGSYVPLTTLSDGTGRFVDEAAEIVEGTVIRYALTALDDATPGDAPLAQAEWIVRPATPYIRLAAKDFDGSVEVSYAGVSPDAQRVEVYALDPSSADPSSRTLLTTLQPDGSTSGFVDIHSRLLAGFGDYYHLGLVTVINDISSGLDSSGIEDHTIAPRAADGLQYADNDEVGKKLYWTNLSANEEGFNVFALLAGEDKFTRIGTAPRNAESFVVDESIDAQQFAVIAFNRVNASDVPGNPTREILNRKKTSLTSIAYVSTATESSGPELKILRTDSTGIYYFGIPVGYSLASTDPLYQYYAGAAVHVTVSGAVTEQYDDARYDWKWEFFDGSRGGKYNVVRGYNAAHIYDNDLVNGNIVPIAPGTVVRREVRLTISSFETGNTVFTEGLSVAIRGDDRQTTRVSNNPGTGEVAWSLVRSDPSAHFASNKRVLFKRGETFDYDTILGGFNLKGQRDLFIGDFGSGPKPILYNDNATFEQNGSTFTSRFFLVGDGSSDAVANKGEYAAHVQFSNLTIDTPFTIVDDQKKAARLFDTGGRGITVRGVYIDNASGPESSQHFRGIHIESLNSGPTTMLRYGFFSERQDPPTSNAGFSEGLSIYGANLNGSVAESNLRVQGAVRRIAIAGNVSSVTVDKSPLRASANGYIWIRDNVFSGRGNWIGPQTDGGLSAHQVDDTTKHLVLENNRFNNSQILLNNGLSESVIRNNAFDWSTVNTSFAKSAFLHRDDAAGSLQKGTLKDTKVRDVLIVHNTWLNPRLRNNGERPAFIQHIRASALDNVPRLLNLTVSNNLVAFTSGQTAIPVEIVEIDSGSNTDAFRQAYADEIRGTGTSGGRWKIRDNVWSTGSVVTVKSGSPESLTTWNSYYVNNDSSVPSGDLDRDATVTAQAVTGTERFVPVAADATKVNIGNRTIPTYISAAPQIVALLDALGSKRPNTQTVTAGQTELNPIP
jgi:hypothetical protein